MKYLYLLIAFFVCYGSVAQVRVGDSYALNRGSGSISSSLLEKFKSTTTYFVVDEDMGIKSEDINEILKDIWTITPFEVIKYEELNTYMKEGNSFMMPKNIAVSNGKSTFSYHILELFIPKKIKKKKNGEYKWNANDKLASIFFTLDISGRAQVVGRFDKIYADLLTYRIGYLKNFFQFVNNKVGKRISVNVFDDYKVKEEFKKLKSKTLFFSKDLIYGYSPFKVKEKDSYTIDELKEEYDYDLEVIDDNTLNNMIRYNKGNTFYYLLNSQVNGVKILSVINGKTGEIIYQEIKKLSYNLKPKDFKQLSRAINSIK